MLRSTIVVIAVAASTPAAAADIVVDIKGPSGRPVSDAVISYRPSQSAASSPGPARTYELVQEKIQFIPHVLVVPVGADVVFPNHDKVRHHVYSFSTAKRFELKLYGRQEARSVRFDKPGVAAIGCNIHDSMSAFIYVSDTPFVAKSDENGHVLITGVPAGAGTISIWQSQLRQPRNEMSRPLVVPAKGEVRQTLTLDVRDAAPMPPMPSMSR